MISAWSVSAMHGLLEYAGLHALLFARGCVKNWCGLSHLGYDETVMGFGGIQKDTFRCKSAPPPRDMVEQHDLGVIVIAVDLSACAVVAWVGLGVHIQHLSVPLVLEQQPQGVVCDHLRRCTGWV